MSVYDFLAKTIEGPDKSLKDYEGKVLLIVNTASECGFTPQFEGLQDLYEKYQNRGFEVLGFPCNQFKNQDPGTDQQIFSFCEDRKSTRLNSSHVAISYAVFCLKKRRH